MRPSRDYILSILKDRRIEFSKYGVKQIGLFGSTLRNEHQEESDIDILIDFDTNSENFDNYMAVCDLLESLFNNKRVDVVTRNGLSPYLGPGILNEVEYA